MQPSVSLLVNASMALQKAHRRPAIDKVNNRQQIEAECKLAKMESGVSID